ncbi:MAG: cation transporter [Chloroflexi bacterium]|nr:cation transporter [Chloroflexota bacterium]
MSGQKSPGWVATFASPRELAQAVAAYTTLLLVKLAVYLQTGMISVLALALHSLSDVVASAFLLLAELMLPRGGRPAHSLAAGRARSAAALLAATVTMSFISFRLAEEALGYLLNPRLAVYRTPELAFALVLGSMLAGCVPIVRALRQRRPRPLARLPGEAHLMGALNDELSLLVGLGGIVLLNHGLRYADAWAALAIALRRPAARGGDGRRRAGRTRRAHRRRRGRRRAALARDALREGRAGAAYRAGDGHSDGGRDAAARRAGLPGLRRRPRGGRLIPFHLAHGGIRRGDPYEPVPEVQTSAWSGDRLY